MATAAGSHVWLLWKRGWFSSPLIPPLSLSLPSSPPHHPPSSFTSLARKASGRPWAPWLQQIGSWPLAGPSPCGPTPLTSPVSGPRGSLLSHSGMWLFPYKVWGTSNVGYSRQGPKQILPLPGGSCVLLPPPSHVQHLQIAYKALFFFLPQLGCAKEKERFLGRKSMAIEMETEGKGNIQRAPSYLSAGVM